MPEDVTLDNEVIQPLSSSSRKRTKTKGIFSWKYCQAGVAILLIYVQLNFAIRPQNAMFQTMLSYTQSNEIEHSLFEILCTTERRRMAGGSYIIRCRDFKGFAEHCTKGVRVHLYSHDQLIFKPKVSTTNFTDGWKKDFNATITVKIGLAPKPRFGKLFLDVVDRYTSFDGLDPQVQVIVQSDYQAQDQFPNRTYHVVEHWYNSFPQDMLAGSAIPNFDVPKIEVGAVSNDTNDTNANTTLKLATVWTNTKQPCPAIRLATLPNISDARFDCINEKFGIVSWYEKYFQDSTELQRLKSLLEDPKQGPGRIYYELFWQYDVLVVPAKTALPEKLRYGNVQRAVSQMRSGVPVLLEIKGEVLEDFMTMYNYTCVYQNNDIGNELTNAGKTSKKANVATVATLSSIPNSNYNGATLMRNKYWTLDEAVMAMRKSPKMRKQCQQEGLAIAADYSPAKLVERELRILGYDGHFECPS